MSEKLFLDFIQEHNLYGPRASYAKVYVNGTYWGLYLAVEQIDKTFLQWNFGSKTGNLYKGDLNTTACADLKYHGNIQSYYNCYELKTNEIFNDWSGLINLTYQINMTTDQEFRDSLENVMNTNSFLGAWASCNLFADFDSYSYRFIHNYYIYDNDSTGKFEWITWDVSTAFGLDIPWSIPQVENADIYYIWPLETDRPLNYRMMQDTIYKQTYTDLMCQYIDDFDPAIFIPKIDSIYSAIQADVYADSLKMYTNQNFEDDITSTTNIGGFDIPGLKSFIANRYNSVRNQLDSIGCPVIVGISNPSNTFADRVRIYPNPFSTSTTIEFGNNFLILFRNFFQIDHQL